MSRVKKRPSSPASELGKDQHSTANDTSFHDLSLDAERYFQCAVQEKKYQELADLLGVSAPSLKAISCGWDGRVWTFPEQDADLNIIGIGTRDKSGKKLFLSGGHRGLIFPPGLDPGRPIFVCEGPSDTAALLTLGFQAVGRPSAHGGVKILIELLRGFETVTVVGENDENGVGQKAAKSVAQQLASAWGRPVRWALPPSGHNDVRAWLGERTRAGLDLADNDACDAAGVEFLKSLEAVTHTIEPADKADGADSQSKRDSQGDVLIGIVETKDVELFHTCDGDSEGYATILADDRAITLPIRSRQFRRWLSREYYTLYNGAPNARAMTDALGVIEGKAIFDGSEHNIHVRLAEHGEAIYLDLGGPEYNYVKIDAAGWSIISSTDAPVRFVRKSGMAPIASPVHGGSLGSLKKHLNVNPDQYVLVLAYLVATLSPHGPHPILVINGEAGTAKTTAARVLRKFVDPNKALVRAAPRDARDLIIAATNSWLVSFDNLSKIQPWLSDSLCRLSTGGGFATRELYSDDSEAIFDARRPIILNGIENIVARGDLRDRAINLTLEPIDESNRLDERTFWRRFDNDAPGILGALLDGVVCGLKGLDDVCLEKLPRMADFCRWAVACSPGLGLGDGKEFLEIYSDDRAAGRLATLDFEPVAAPLISMIENQPEWAGTFTELLDDLEDADAGDDQSRRRQGWPKSARGLSGALRRIASDLREIGVCINFPDRRGRGRDGRTVHINLLKPLAQPSTSSTCAQPALGACEEDIRVDG